MTGGRHRPSFRQVKNLLTHSRQSILEEEGGGREGRMREVQAEGGEFGSGRDDREVAPLQVTVVGENGG